MDGRFDRDYYERYYRDPASRVTSRAEMNARGRLIGACAAHIGLPVKRVLDAGCGVGLLRAPLRRVLPKAEYTGIEVSAWLCRRYGWTQSSIEAYRTGQPFDLVVCYDVLQYLGDAQAQRALANLARLCRGLLYFSALTAADWRENCDQSRTDRNVHLRRGEWYRTRLRRRFREIGAGFWLRKDAPLPLWELETAGRSSR
ncbi:MAG: trans-aconitate 2-methyltransferase [Steroidobacteraceae bacterium]